MTRALNVVEIIAKSLVDSPELVNATEVDTDDGVKISLRAESGSLGKLIGRRGRTAEAIRALATATAELENQHVTIHFLDD